jgi:zinc protease
LKPTDFKQDEVLLRAFSPGGHSLASDAEYVAASTASQVVAAGGLGKMSALDLGKALTGKVASVRPSIATLEEGLSGGGSSKDLETLFQLVYLTFTSPRADPDIFKVLVENARTSLANQTARPEYAFSTTLNAVLTQNHPRARPLTPELLGEMSLERSMAFYKDRFADAGDFTFVCVGSFTPDTLRPLVEQYLASLPSAGRAESFRDLGIRPPRGVVERRVEKGIEPKSQTVIVYTGPFEYDPEHRAVIRAMGMVLETRLRLALREELGGTYGVSVSPGTSRIPRQEYSISIGFGSNPDRTAPLVDRVHQEIERLKQDGPTEREVADAREQMTRDHESGMRRNDYLLANLAGRYQAGEDPSSLFDMTPVFGRIDVISVRDAARRYLDSQNTIRVSLFPQAAGAASAPAASQVPAGR